MLVTELVKQAFAFHAKLSLERILGIVDAGVNYFAISAAGLQSKSAVLFKDENLFLSLCDFTSRSQTDHSSANDCYIDFSKHLSFWLLRVLE
jgi:hypothetical protein